MSRSECLLPGWAAHGLQLILWDHILHIQPTGVRDDAQFPTLPPPPHLKATEVLLFLPMWETASPREEHNSHAVCWQPDTTLVPEANPKHLCL